MWPLFVFPLSVKGNDVNPFQSLLISRKFWLLILDTVISLVLFFGAKYLSPSALEDVKVLVIALQPVFVTIIAAIAHEDAANAKASTGITILTGRDEGGDE